MESHDKKGEARFRRIGIITIIAVYLLILVGGIVRSTGSGMGCPDWPKCFGSWVPPGDVSELPADYKAIYSAKRQAKNEKLSGYLEFFGFSELANNIRHDAAILAETAFNPVKTRIEYINRLLGATTGILIILTFICSLVYLNKANIIPILAFSSLVLVIFQGWIGSVVVSTNLLPWMITIHMLLAFLLLALLIYMLYYASPEYKASITGQKSGLVKKILLLCLFTLLVQVVVGTQVREAIDEIAIAFQFENRAAWIGELDLGFYFHRSFSIIVLGLHVWLLVVLLKKFNKNSQIIKLTNLLMLFVGLEIVSGIIMAYFAIPSYMQPVHLLLSSLIFGFQFLLLLMMSYETSERGQDILSKDTLLNLDNLHEKQIAFKG